MPPSDNCLRDALILCVMATLEDLRPNESPPIATEVGGDSFCAGVGHLMSREETSGRDSSSVSQYDQSMQPARLVVDHVAAELETFLGPCGAAAWFIAGNLWLGDRLPLDVLRDDPDSVLGAARADRYVALTRRG